MTEQPIDDAVATDAADASLLALIDRLAAVVDRSGLAELEVEAGGTTLVLRSMAALSPPVVEPQSAAGVAGSAATSGGASSVAAPAAPARPAVLAPLTGIWYSSPAPGSAPYVTAGGEIAVGQVVGLIEAMKLFNEIKSDLAGRVVRVVPETGTLVKARQPLIEVEPL
jgi:acetyl-CoA carboxylase biotin carboxyl carrier protein